MLPYFEGKLCDQVVLNGQLLLLGSIPVLGKIAGMFYPFLHFLAALPITSVLNCALFLLMRFTYHIAFNEIAILLGLTKCVLFNSYLMPRLLRRNALEIITQ